ncbi:hypothetical protein CMV30_08575 [Nibricoccus aquaticus]|uniref:Uncharacterized protein n=1 Tax=Nibricoccus aquaticus TaxID=2576891 RepID=A0A290QCM8_9BACT|nr:hypothetical protein CMV30_08575 [Nibricoccus aquaticus]
MIGKNPRVCSPSGTSSGGSNQLQCIQPGSSVRENNVVPTKSASLLPASAKNSPQLPAKSTSYSTIHTWSHPRSRSFMSDGSQVRSGNPLASPRPALRLSSRHRAGSNRSASPSVATRSAFIFSTTAGAVPPPT